MQQVVRKELSTAARVLGRAGGRATAAKLTPAQRRASARRAVRARWERWRKENNGRQQTA